MLLALRLDNSNLSKAQRLDGLRSPPRTNPSDLRGVHEHPPAWFRNERHGSEDRSILTVLQLGPYPFLRLSRYVKRFRRGSVGGSACNGADETGPKEDGKDPEVLGGVI